MAIFLSAAFIYRETALVTRAIDSENGYYDAHFHYRHPATKSKYSVNNVSRILLLTESVNLDTWLPNSDFIRPGIYTTDPHSQVSNKETFVPSWGKDAAIFTA